MTNCAQTIALINKVIQIDTYSHISSLMSPVSPSVSHYPFKQYSNLSPAQSKAISYHIRSPPTSKLDKSYSLYNNPLLLLNLQFLSDERFLLQCNIKKHIFYSIEVAYFGTIASNWFGQERRLCMTLPSNIRK